MVSYDSTLSTRRWRWERDGGDVKWPKALRIPLAHKMKSQSLLMMMMIIMTLNNEPKRSFTLASNLLFP